VVGLMLVEVPLAGDFTVVTLLASVAAVLPDVAAVLLGVAAVVLLVLWASPKAMRETIAGRGLDLSGTKEVVVGDFSVVLVEDEDEVAVVLPSGVAAVVVSVCGQYVLAGSP